MTEIEFSNELLLESKKCAERVNKQRLLWPLVIIALSIRVHINKYISFIKRNILFKILRKIIKLFRQILQ